MSAGKDLVTYQSYLHPPGLTIPGGSVLCIVDFTPGVVSSMHRMICFDYGVVLDAEIELILDSGETRTMKRGDIAIQRGTNHAWRNKGTTEWARVLYVLQKSQPLQLDGGITLGEDYGQEGLEGVRPSYP
jgi:hypothetical protein